MGILAMDDSTAQGGSQRSLAALEDVLDLQRRIVESSAEMSWLVKRFQTAQITDRPAVQEQLDDLTATLLKTGE
jgi:hypothetical protein